MANRRSTYVFHYERDFEDAKDHIHREYYQEYYDSDCFDFYGYWGSCSRFGWDDCYRIDIMDRCSDPVGVASILKEHDGHYYEL